MEELEAKSRKIRAWILTAGAATIASYFGPVNRAVIAVHGSDFLPAASACSPSGTHLQNKSLFQPE